MRLGAKILKNVVNINYWDYSDEAHVFESQANNIYIQIVDLDKSPVLEQKSVAFPEFPMRYISTASAISVEAIFDSIDDDEQFTVTATQPFADDKSIWQFSLTNTQLPKSGNFQIKITEDGTERTFLITNGIKAELLNVGSC